MRSLKGGLLYLLCAPWDAAVLALSLPLLVLGARAHRRLQGALWLDVREGSWIERRWRYSTTFGHAVLLQPNLRGSSVETHELVHVRQFEGAVCAIWLAALVGGVVACGTTREAGCVAVVLLGPWWSYAGASLAAWLRDERPYLDNHFERHARAETAPRGRM